MTLTRLALVLVLLSGCSSLSVSVAEQCHIVRHSFARVEYWVDVKCISGDNYRRGNEPPPKVILEELLDAEE